MNLLASVLFGSFAVAAVTGCSSDDNSNAPTYPPFDSGKVTVPEAGPSAAPVTIVVVGNGFVESTDGVLDDAGVTVNATVLCGTLSNGSKATACTAPQGIQLYGEPNTGALWGAWTATVDGGLVAVESAQDYSTSAATPNPLTATFITQADGPDAAPAPVTPVADAATGG